MLEDFPYNRTWFGLVSYDFPPVFGDLQGSGPLQKKRHGVEFAKQRFVKNQGEARRVYII